MSSVGAFPVRPFLTKSCRCPWQCKESLCIEGSVQEFSIFRMCYLFMFFQDARKLHSLLFLFMFFGEQEGREGEAVRKNTCHLRASSYSTSFLNPSNKKNVLILCSNNLYSRPTKCINTFFAFEDLHSEWNFCFEPYLLDLLYFCLWGGNSLWWQGLNYSG